MDAFFLACQLFTAGWWGWLLRAWLTPPAPKITADELKIGRHVIEQIESLYPMQSTVGEGHTVYQRSTLSKQGKTNVTLIVAAPSTGGASE